MREGCLYLRSVGNTGLLLTHVPQKNFLRKLY